MMYYKELPNLALHHKIVEKISLLDCSELSRIRGNVGSEARLGLATSNPWWFFWTSRHRQGKINWQLLKSYGLFFHKVGYYKSFILPKILKCAVLKSLHPWIKNMPEKPVVILQTIYGAKRIPMHVDPLSTVGLLIPISNHENSHTNFYTSDQHYSAGSVVDPQHCTLIHSINVLAHPVLINTTKIHDVTIDPRQHTKQNPRLTVNVKWSKMTFEQVVSYF